MTIKGKDGETHINIYSQAETSLGVWLSNFTYCPIKILEDGEFNSIEGYWYWLLCKDDRLRQEIGFGAKRLGRSLIAEPVDDKLSDEFKNKIKSALDLKIKSNQDRMKEFYESELPFAHYYVYGNKKIDAGYKWILEHFENRRKELKMHFKDEK